MVIVMLLITLAQTSQAQRQNCKKRLAMAMLVAIATYTSTPLPASQAQSIARTSTTYFSGNSANPQKPGGDYIVFRTKGQQVRGLVYVQNSDDGACFQGTYSPSTRKVSNVTFAHPPFGSERWEFVRSQTPLRLQAYRHTLNPGQMSSGADRWFHDCLTIFNKR